MSPSPSPVIFLFFFNDTATTEIYTLSLHDALPISGDRPVPHGDGCRKLRRGPVRHEHAGGARLCLHLQPRSEEQRLNSSHQIISYAVFCLKKKKIPSPTSTESPTQELTTLYQDQSD